MSSLSPANLFFLLFGNVVWVGMLGLYAKRRMGLPTRPDNLLWRSMAGLLLVAAWIWGYEPVAWLAREAGGIVALELFLVGWSAVVGWRMSCLPLYLSFGVATACAQLLAFHALSGSSVSNHLGTLLLAIPVFVGLAVVESFRQLRARTPASKS